MPGLRGIVPSEYDIRRAAGLPRQWWRRRKERGNDPLAISYLEASRYRKDAYNFIGARMENPELLSTFPDLTPGSRLVDVGAFQGRWSRAVVGKYDCEVEAFELAPEFWEPLREVAASVPQIRVHEYGLGARDEWVRISQTDMGSSVFVNPVSGTDVPWTNAHIRDIAEVWDELGWTRIAVMKLNIEGGEYDVLERLIETGLHSKVECFLVQFHEWIPRAHIRRRRILRALRATHEPRWSYPWVWEMWQLRDRA